MANRLSWFLPYLRSEPERRPKESPAGVAGSQHEGQDHGTHAQPWTGTHTP